MCSCSLEIESTSHFFLRCQNLMPPRTNLMNELRTLDSSIFNLDGISFAKFLLYGDGKFKNKVKKKRFYKCRTLYKAIWRPTDLRFFLNTYLLAIALSFCFYALRFYISWLITWTEKGNEVLFLVCECIISISVLLLLTLVCTSVYLSIQ